MSDSETDAVATISNLIKAPRTRRDFLAKLGIATASMTAGSMLSACGSSNGVADAEDNIDVSVLNFALNLEYLEAEYYLRGFRGSGLIAGDRGANSGTVVGGRQVAFSRNSGIGDYAREIADDEEKHVKFLRQALGGDAVSAPNLNFTDAFAALGFDPFANEVNFLLGAFVFEDVGVTAYNGGASLIQDKAFLQAAASILAVEAYHAASVRTLLFGLSRSNPAILGTVQAISDARDGVDGEGDKDQTITGFGGPINIVPTDEFSLVFSRSTAEVLRIVYLNAAGTPGGFFPNGLNGAIR